MISKTYFNTVILSVRMISPYYYERKNKNWSRSSPSSKI